MKKNCLKSTKSKWIWEEEVVKQNLSKLEIAKKTLAFLKKLRSFYMKVDTERGKKALNYWCFSSISKLNEWIEDKEKYVKELRDEDIKDKY